MMPTAKVQFEEMCPWEFAQAIETAPICYLPLSGLECLGENYAVGLDTSKTIAVCTRAVQQADRS